MLLNKNLGGVLLIAGTCIGAGMLALPISTAPVGFWTAGLLIILAGVLMMITGLYTAEVNLWFKGSASFITMTEKTLGKASKRIVWCLFLFLLYALVAAYIAGGASLTTHFFSTVLQQSYPEAYSLLPWGLAFCLLVYLGTCAVDVINKLLVIGLIISYVILMVVLAPHVHFVPHTFVSHPSFIWAALPILLTSYGYHIVIPSVSHYMDHNAKKLRMAIIIGSSAALTVYLIWVYLVFGVASMGAGDQQALLSSRQSTESLTAMLSSIVANPWISTVIGFFIFFALSTSFIGVALGLFHMIADGLKIKQNSAGKILVALITFLPPLLFAAFYPNGFILALSYAGVVVALLHSILPTVMVWRGRYHLKLSRKNDYRVMGGKPVMLIIILLSCLVIGIAIAGYCGWTPHV